MAGEQDLTARFTEDQGRQILVWLSAGESARLIVERIKQENASGAGLYPWNAVTVPEMESLRGAIKPLIADVRLRVQEEAIAEGIGRREQQLVSMVDVITRTNPMLEQISDGINRQIALGALIFTEESLSVDGERHDPSIFEGEIVGRDRYPAVREPARVAEARASGLDPMKLLLKEGQLDRFVKLTDAYRGLMHEYTNMQLILGRIATNIDRDQPIDWQGRQANLRRIADKMDNLGKKAAAIDPEITLDDDEPPDIDD